MFKPFQAIVIVTSMVLVTVLPAFAGNPSKMRSICKGLAAKEYSTNIKKIIVKYEGQRTNGTHSVNGTYETSKMTNTFQCSFNKAGTVVVDFIKNKPHSKVDEGSL